MKQTESQSDEASYRQSPEYQAASDFLMGRINYERVPKMPYSNKEMNLDRMRRLLGLLGDPHDKVDLIHVAGTKGKGSTAAFLSSALCAHGLRCGSYTSPHLHDIEERYRLNGKPCSPETFVALVEQIRPSVEELDAGEHDDRVTYFDIATALGFMFFLHERADVAVVEVGLGGRLDSTNICNPMVSVITSISFDHMKQLGNTLSLIAAEKAGIIKPGVPIVSGVAAVEPRNVIQDIAKQQNAPLTQFTSDFRYANYRTVHSGTELRSFVDFEAHTDGEWRPVLEGVRLGCLGEHQAANASVAWATLNLLQDARRPDPSATRVGFARTQSHARVEVVATDPLIIVDAAHNAASAKALADTLDEFETRGSRWLILATTRGKDVSGMLEFLLPQFDRVVCTRYENNPRGHQVESLVKLLEDAVSKTNHATKKPPTKKPATIVSRPTPADAWQHVMEQSQSCDLICITGSFFIAAELRELILNR